MKMARESRKITDTLIAMAETYKIVQGDITPAHIYICDAVTINYSQAPIMNILKKQIRNVKNKEWKHFTIDYWCQYIINVANKMPNIKRDISYKPDIKLPSDITLESFRYIIDEYLIADYSLDDAILINKMCDNSINDIIHACNIGKSNNVYEPRYISAVLEKDMARKEVEDKRHDKINEMIKQSDKFLGKDVHDYNIIELATIQYSWEERKQNAELERKFFDIFNKEDK